MLFRLKISLNRLRRRNTFATAPAESDESLSVSDFARRKLGFNPDPLQAAVLDSRAKRGILNCTRQWGKSSVQAVKAVHRALTVAGSLILIASPSDRQSAEFVTKCAGFLQRVGVSVCGDGHNARSLKLPNGSRIVGVPGTEATVRGFSAVSLMIIDEASRVPDAMFHSLRPMLAVAGGDLWLMSTPFGQRGFFYEVWTEGEGWERYSVSADKCPRIPPDFLEQERKSMTAAWFAQEYMCHFTSDSTSFLSRELLEASLVDAPPLNI